MIDTSRIASGFDVEFQLGSGWFRTALDGLAVRGLLVPPGTIPFLADDATFEVTAVTVDADATDRDLVIELLVGGILPVTIDASLELSDDGSELTFTHSLDDDPVVVPFDALSDLAGPPVLAKLAGDDEREDVMAVLANLDLRATGQGSDPLPPGEHVERGETAAARSFLPLGRHVALGVADQSLRRFANDIWHEQLTDEDGDQPFPDADDRQGSWNEVSMSAIDGRIRVRLEATAEVDSPLIDIVPDPDISISIDLVPSMVDGRLRFEVTVDASVDFGLLGDLLAGFVGGVIGFVVGLFTGNPVGGAAIGAAAGIVVLEIGEYAAGAVIRRELQAEIDGEPAPGFYTCRSGVVHLATVVSHSEGLDLGVLDAIPTSVPLHVENPDPLFERTVAVAAHFDEFVGDGAGFAMSATTSVTEIDMPVDAHIVGRTTDGDALTGLTYRTTAGEEHTLTVEDVLTRAAADGVPSPLDVLTDDGEELDEHKQPGQVPIACLHPAAIQREETVIRAIRFTTGLELDTQDTIELQDGGALLLPGLQLIRPSDANPYYRAPADGTTANNLESLPEF